MGTAALKLDTILLRIFLKILDVLDVIVYIPYKSDNVLREEAPTNNFIFSTTSTLRASYTI
jgi:hypothetical protein